MHGIGHCKMRCTYSSVSFTLILLCHCLAGSVFAFSTTHHHGLCNPSRRYQSSRQIIPLHAAGAAHAAVSKIPFWAAKPPPPPPPSAATVIHQQVAELAKHSAILGNLKAVTAKVATNPDKIKLILSGMAHAIEWEELVFFAFMGWGFVPLLGVPQTLLRDFFISKNRDVRPFKRSYTKLVADNVAGISRIGFFVYITDIVKILLIQMGFKFKHLTMLPQVVGKALVRRWNLCFYQECGVVWRLMEF